MRRRDGARRARLLVAAWVAGELAVVAAVALCAAVALTQGDASHPPRHPYWPFTSEVVVWDVGANPWDGCERPSLTPTLMDELGPRMV